MSSEQVEKSCDPNGNAKEIRVTPNLHQTIHLIKDTECIKVMERYKEREMQKERDTDSQIQRETIKLNILSMDINLFKG